MAPQTAAKTVRIVGYLFLLFAFVWGLAPYVSINAPARWLIDLLDWPFGDALATLDRSEKWLSAIGSGLTAGISIMLIGMVAPAVARSDRQVTKVTIWAFVVWYIVDSVGSIASGVPSNAFFNAILLTAILVPLLLVRFEDT